MRASAIAALLCSLAAACASPASDPAGISTAEALSAVPAGTFAIDREPREGTWVRRVTLSADKAFEAEFVTRVDGEEEAVVLAGTYQTFAGMEHEPVLAFDVEDGMLDGATKHFIFDYAATATTITLTPSGGDAFTLKKTSAPPEPTDVRVITCKGDAIGAVITLDQAQRRRGHIVLGQNPATPLVYTGHTGISDYMRYEGRDRQGNEYELALKKSDVAKTHGPISEVGVGFNSGLLSMSCTISRP
jgi:hypothetical protein